MNQKLATCLISELRRSQCASTPKSSYVKIGLVLLITTLQWKTTQANYAAGQIYNLPKYSCESFNQYRKQHKIGKPKKVF